MRLGLAVVQIGGRFGVGGIGVGVNVGGIDIGVDVGVDVGVGNGETWATAISEPSMVRLIPATTTKIIAAKNRFFFKIVLPLFDNVVCL